MARVKLDPDVIGLSSIMERMTHARVKDSFQDGDLVCYIVAPGEMGKALGKGGSSIRKIQEKLGKKVKIIEFNDDVTKFVRNIILPLRVEKITIEGNTIIIEDSQKKTKSLLIGRQGRNLELLKRAVKRFFSVEIKIK